MVNQLAEELRQRLSLSIISKEDKHKFLERIAKQRLIRDENKESHFCIYFAAFDPIARQVFIGHHRKSGLWLFNGGHIDKGETLYKAIEREMNEEWGIPIGLTQLPSPSLLTITKILNNQNQKCKSHYDVWYFIKVNKSSFFPVKEKSEKEFIKAGWFNTEEAMRYVIDPNTLKVLNMLEKQFQEPDIISK